jgi:hypothetical protein
MNTESSNQNAIATLVSDVVLLLTMLVGLLRLNRNGVMGGFGQLLWKQGLVWLFLATVAEVPPVVFLVLNLNGPLNLMFQTPALIGMTIAATRMYRSLTDFSDSGQSRSSFDTYATQITDTKQIFELQLPLDRMEVAVHTSTEDCPPPPNLGHYPVYAV